MNVIPTDTTSPIELGVFSFADLSGTATPEERLRDIVDFGERADQLGLQVFGVGEHHTSRFAVPSPAVVLGAIAARTSTVKLTSAVSVLSVLDPVRLYQDFAQLDLVSGGRAEITAGRSAYAEPFEIFGVPMAEYDAVFGVRLRAAAFRTRALRRGLSQRSSRSTAISSRSRYAWREVTWCLIPIEVLIIVCATT